MNDKTEGALVGRLERLDKLYKMHLAGASYENWKQHCEVWRYEMHEAADTIEQQARELQEAREALTKVDALIRQGMAERDARLERLRGALERLVNSRFDYTDQQAARKALADTQGEG